MGPRYDGHGEQGEDGGIAVADPVRAVDPLAGWRSVQEIGRTHGPTPGSAPEPGRVPVVHAPHPVPELAPSDDLDAEVAGALAVLDAPDLVVSDGYVGRERRRLGTWAQVARATWSSRRRMLRLDLLIVVALVVMLTGALLLVSATGTDRRPSPAGAAVAPAGTTTAAPAAAPSAASAASAPSAAAGGSAAVRSSDVPPRGTRTSTTLPPAVAAPAPAVASVASSDAQVGAAPGTPEAMGAAALALVRYPWRQLPGYSIVFRSIDDAPSPGFYGNTSFTWGTPGGVSTLYVYPGETVERLAAITAFEIGHEVDAGYVEPQGGHDAIESLLGIHPASWAPQCDCAEQAYLSGWYAAAFSDYWSPGVGAWSSIAPVPTGATLVAMEPWLDPRVP